MPETALDIVDHHLLEIGGNGCAAQGHGLLAVDEDRRGRLLARSRERNPDVGDALMIRNGGRQERVALSDISNVSYASFVNPPRVTLSLRTPGAFGSRVTFCAPIRLVPFSTSPVIDALIERIDAARRR